MANGPRIGTPRFTPAPRQGPDFWAPAEMMPTLPSGTRCTARAAVREELVGRDRRGPDRFRCVPPLARTPHAPKALSGHPLRGQGRGACHSASVRPSWHGSCHALIPRRLPGLPRQGVEQRRHVGRALSSTSTKGVTKWTKKRLAEDCGPAALATTGDPELPGKVAQLKVRQQSAANDEAAGLSMQTGGRAGSVACLAVRTSPAALFGVPSLAPDGPLLTGCSSGPPAAAR